jgi:hypothetical protein
MNITLYGYASLLIVARGNDHYSVWIRLLTFAEGLAVDNDRRAVVEDVKAARLGAAVAPCLVILRVALSVPFEREKGKRKRQREVDSVSYQFH